MAFTKNEIELKVVKFFIRELKDRNMLHLLYCGTNVNDRLFQMFRSVTQKAKPNYGVKSDSPFRGCATQESFVNVLDQLNGQLSSHYQMDEAGIITMSINHLIHFFVEPVARHIGGIEMLNEFGQSIFNRTIASLYGNDKVQAFNEKSNENILPSDIKAKLWAKYIDGCARGSINVGFDAFVADTINQFISKQMGQSILPDEYETHEVYDETDLWVGDEEEWTDDDELFDEDI